MTRSLEKEEQHYWDKWKTDRDPNAGEQLLQLYMPLVNFHVQRIAVGLPRGINSDELMSHGMIGLYDALNKFDVDRDLKFDTYASFRIRGAILDELRKEDWVPRSLREKAKKIDATIGKLQQKYLRPVTTKEVAEEIGLKEDNVVEIQSESFLANILSIDEDYRHSEENDHASVPIEDKKAVIPEQELDKQETILGLTKVIESLTEKEKLVVNLFYYEELTLTEIGKVLSLSTSRISQIHSKALFRLKQSFLQDDETIDLYKEG